MNQENVEKLKELRIEDLEKVARSDTKSFQIELFDIQIYNRYHEVTSVIREIGETDGICCGLLMPLSYCRLSEEETIASDMKSLAYVDPDGGPLISSGTRLAGGGGSADHKQIIEITDIYLKDKFFVVFYKKVGTIEK